MDSSRSSRPQVRTDLALRAGYHSPQIDRACDEKQGDRQQGRAGENRAGQRLEPAQLHGCEESGDGSAQREPVALDRFERLGELFDTQSTPMALQEDR